jgi:hypothetical protein
LTAERHEDGGGDSPAPSSDGVDAAGHRGKTSDLAQTIAQTCVKPLKPREYDSSPCVDKFTVYMAQIISYCKAGAIESEQQVQTAGYFLTGKAESYYYSQIAHEAYKWDLHDFFVALFDYLFDSDFIQTQRERIKTYCQGTQKPHEFAKALERIYAMLPTEHDRTKVLRLWDSLRIEIQVRLTELGFNPEVNTWKTIVDEAGKVHAANMLAEKLRSDKERDDCRNHVDDQHHTYRHQERALGCSVNYGVE